jgi:hypothetical protein
MLRLRQPRVDQAQGSPADVIARLGERENHAQMVTRPACPERSRRGGWRVAGASATARRGQSKVES